MLLMGHMREGRRTTMKEYEVFKERFRQGLKESGLTPLSFSRSYATLFFREDRGAGNDGERVGH